MDKRKRLSKKQLTVIEDVFGGELDEQAVLDKHGVSRRLYNRWLADELFAGEFNEWIASSRRQGELIIARYAPVAAAKLVALTESENPETARKACLDIISSMLDARRATVNEGRGTRDEPQACQLSEQTASRLLAALAEEKNDG